MKILVCFKVVKDIDYILKEDWENIANITMDWSYVKNIFNCFDEGALENALRLKDKLIINNIPVELHAITTTEVNCDLFNKLLLAVGYDKVVNLKGTADYFLPKRNAQIIYNYIQNENYDLIFTGFENAVGNNGVFPYTLAKLLNFNVLNKVTELDYCNGIIATIETETSFEKYGISEKTLFIIKNTENSSIRFPSLMDRLKAKNKPEIIEKIDNYNSNILENDLQIVNTKYVEEKANTNFLPNSIKQNVDFVLNEVQND